MSDLQTKVSIQIVDLFSAPLRKLKESLGGVGQTASGLKDKLQLAANLNQAAEAAGRFGDGLLRIAKPAIQDFANLEARMSEVGAITESIGTGGFKLLTEQAQKLGEETAFTADEVASSMAELARAGKNTAEIYSTIPTILSLAKASGAGLSETAQVLGNTMNGMGLSASESARTADILTQAIVKSGAKLPELGDAFKMVAPLAKQAKMSTEDLATSIGLLSRNGIKGSEAGTGLRAVMSSLINPLGQADKALARIGISGAKLVNVQKKVASGDFAGALADIGQKLQKLPETKRLEALSQIFGREAVSSASVLIDATLDPSVKGFDHLRKQVTDSQGAADRMAKTMQNNLAGAMERAGGAIQGLSTKLGEVLAPKVKALSADIEKAAGQVGDWAKRNPELVQTILDVTIKLGALALGVKALALTVSTITTITAAVRTLVTFMTGPTGLVIAAGAVGIAIGTWANKTFDLANKISTLFGQPDRNTGKKGDQTYADGTVLNGGKVRTIDPRYFPQRRYRDYKDTEGFLVPADRRPTAATPKVIRDALASGATSVEDVNRYMSRSASQGASSSFRMQPFQVAPDPEMQEQNMLLRQLLEATKNNKPKPGTTSSPYTGAF